MTAPAVNEDLTGSEGARLRRIEEPRPRVGTTSRHRATPEPLGRGATIGRYVVLSLVGRGGMGDVYAAYDPELDRKVAVKLVRARSDGRGDPAEGRSRLLREAQAIARLSHPNVVVAYDVGTFEDSVFIAMEFVDGQTAGYWREAATRSWQEVLAVYRAAGQGLAAAHQAGMVHRDFKPDNVMVTRDGGVRVMDFGLARHVVEEAQGTPAARWAARTAAAIAAGYDPEVTVPLHMGSSPTTPDLTTSSSSRLDSKLTRTGTMLGTPAYMAPEQFAGKPSDARSDQFSFCVALYESLYGERPFTGDSFPALMAAVLAGVVPDPPDTRQASRVPAWIRRIVLRGLSVDPARRYPSMEALLAALAHDPAVAWRRHMTMAGAALAGVAVAGAIGAGVRSTHATTLLCGAGAERLAGVWEGTAAPRTARKAAIARAFAATGSSYAAKAFAGVRQALDRYVEAWSEMYTDACEATHVRGEQSAEVLDLRMSCLGERLNRVKALTDVFAEANPTVVENAVTAAGALPPLDRCSDVKLLRAVVPPPDNPRVQARVEALRKDLAHVKALNDSGQCAAAADEGRRLVTEAHAIGYLPLEAESLNVEARSGWQCMAADEAIRIYKQAILAATASHDEEAEAEAMILLAHIQADRTTDVAQARVWIDLADAVLRGMSGAHPVLESWRLQVLGRILSKEHRFDEALTTFRRAQELMERTVGADHPDVATVINNIGLVLQDMGRFEEALAYFVRAERLTIRVLGPHHPAVALSLGNQGEVLNALRRHGEARAVLERAIEISRRAGSSPFYTAWALGVLGDALLGLGRPREAQGALEEALRLFGGDDTPLMPGTQFALARALWSLPQQRGRALELALAARSTAQKSGVSPRPAEIDDWLRTRTGRQPAMVRQ